MKKSTCRARDVAESDHEPARRAAVGCPVDKVFLLSPAKVSGARAGLLLNPNAGFALAHTFQRKGLSLAEVFTFASGLYFRGKITYARHFVGRSRQRAIRVITTNAGLVDPDTLLTADALRAFGSVDIDATDERYHGPLRRDARELAAKLKPRGVAVLLGSIATAKYRDVLLECFGERLVFPADFVGRGDMSRGGLLLRAAAADQELAYMPVVGAVLNGKRPPKLAPLPRSPTHTDTRRRARS